LLHEGGVDSAAALLRTALGAPVSYLGRAEPRFEIRVQRRPPRRDELSVRNVVLVTLLDAGGRLDALAQRTFPGADLARVRRSGAGLFTYTDVWAREQVVALVAASRRTALDSLLHALSPELAATFDRVVVARWAAALRAAHAETPESDGRRGDVVFDIAVPDAYRRIEPTPGWKGAMRWVRDSPTRIVTLFWLDDVDSSQANSGAFLRGVQRDALWRLNKDTLVEEESDFETMPGGALLVGVWQNEREVAGGPLITRFVHEPAARRLFGIQGMLFAPGRRKHSFFRELRALLYTFTSEEPA
jgi:hypothetical protein